MTDDLPRFEFGGAMMRPAKSSYQVSDPYSATVTNIPGGLSSITTDHLSGVYQISATYQMTRAEAYFWGAFYQSTLMEGSIPFVAELILDNPFPMEYVCQIVAKPSKPKDTGYYREVTLSLEAVADYDDDFNFALVDWMAVYGECSGEMANMFDIFANEWCPEYLNDA